VELSAIGTGSERREGLKAGEDNRNEELFGTEQTQTFPNIPFLPQRNRHLLQQIHRLLQPALYTRLDMCVPVLL
jgi:hypothetical protein